MEMPEMCRIRRIEWAFLKQGLAARWELKLGPQFEKCSTPNTLLGIHSYAILKTTLHQKAGPLHCLVPKYARVLNATNQKAKTFYAM